MKVLYFHQHFKTPSTGGGIRSYEFAKKLIEKGHEVTIVCGGHYKFDLASTEHKNINRGLVDGIDVIQLDLPYANKDSITKRTITFLRFSLMGIRIALKEEYDLLFATSTPLTAGVPGILMKWFSKNKKKFVFEVRDLWPELPKALGMRNPFLLWGMSVLEKISYKKADACIGLSPGICEGIKKRIDSDKPVALIPNGADLDLFYAGDRKDLPLSGISLDKKVAVFTGSHGIANGLDAVLDVAKVLQLRNRNDIIIAFVGDGKMKEHLVRRVDAEGITNCLFFDPVSKMELTHILASADIGLMILKNVPAFYYGTSPNKFFDYIAAGLPILNNYPGWLADMIMQNSCGEVVEPDNPSQFAEALEKLADSSTLRIEYGENSRKLAEEKFSRDKLAKEFVVFLENVYNS